MDLFTVDPWTYEKQTILDEYESAIWTERFVQPGDINLVLPATKDTVQMVKPGTLIGMNNTRELMLIDTRSIENGLATFTGKTVDNHFNEMFISGEKFIDGFSSQVDAFKITKTPGYILADIVGNMQQRHGTGQPNGGPYAIQKFGYGTIAGYGLGTPVEEKIKFGPAGEELLRIATKYSVGMGVFRKRIEPSSLSPFGGYELEFSTWFGTDLRDQVLFSPDLDNLANVKELVSEVNSKDTVYSHPPKALFKKYQPQVGTMRLGQNPYVNPFTKILEISNDDIAEDMLGPDDAKASYFTDPATFNARVAALKKIIRQRARNALREAKKTKMIDGEVTPETQYKYYTEPNPYGDIEYRVGDQVKIDGHFSSPIDGIVTEYIRTSDATGEKAYPTVAPAAEWPAFWPDSE